MPSTVRSSKIVVLGAGVSGLTTALLLSREPNRKYDITVIAKFMPGDYDIQYASPWAGADYVPPSSSMGVSKQEEKRGPLELDTWAELARLAKDVPEAGIHFQEARYYRRLQDKGTEKGLWYEDLRQEENPFRRLLPNFRDLEPSELPKGMDAGLSFTTVCINVALYLPWLTSQCLKAGVVIRRGEVLWVSAAADLHHTGTKADVIVNCTGLSSQWLGGVEDKNVYPVRGQTVLVRNDPGIIVGCTGTNDGPDESTYVMNRAGGGGCILGGCSQKNSRESQPDYNLAIRIMKRAVEVCPQLVPSGKGIEALSVIRHGVGLRPMRTGGIRVEAEVIRGQDGRGVQVVHNYGHGGRGYQTSYGAAQLATSLVAGVVDGKSRL